MLVPMTDLAACTTLRGGMRALTRTLTVEQSPHGSPVVAIGAGMIAAKLDADARKNPDYRANTRRVPLGRPGERAEITGPALFLASGMPRYVTGVTLPVDGGSLGY